MLFLILFILILSKAMGALCCSFDGEAYEVGGVVSVQFCQLYIDSTLHSATVANEGLVCHSQLKMYTPEM